MEQHKTSLLNVYDIHDSNAVFSGLGLGFYHSGIEVCIEGDDTISYEYSFSTGGISRTAPRLRAFGVLRNSIIMGNVRGSAINIHKLISQFGRTTYAPGTYDLINNNCNHFTDAVCFALLETHIPAWVNRFAYIGSTFFPAASPPPAANTQTDGAPSSSSSSNPTPSKSPDGSGPLFSPETRRPPAIRRRDGVNIDVSETPGTDWICGLPFQLPSLFGVSVLGGMGDEDSDSDVVDNVTNNFAAVKLNGEISTNNNNSNGNSILRGNVTGVQS
jgi:hypothetical protein